jgi:hypothetical protein
MANISFSEFLSPAMTTELSEKICLEDEVLLCENGNVVFHWADFYETCDYVKKALESHVELKKDFQKKEKVLNRLKSISVWVRTYKKVFQSSMYDLYEQSIQSRFNLSSGVSLNSEIEVSFISSAGPFKVMSISECFNKETYKDFVMIYLLKDKLPRRDYRLRLKSKVLLQYGHDFSKASLMGLEQLTMNGMLFSIDAEEYMHFIAKETEVKFLIDSATLKSSLGKNLSELNQFLSQFAFNLFYSSRLEDSIVCKLKDFTIQSSFDFHNNRKIYLFVSYDKLSGQSGFEVNILRDFVAHTRTLIRETYNLDKILKLA